MSLKREVRAMPSLKEKLIAEVEKIPGLRNMASPVAGGSALHYHDKEFAHFHNDNELDLRLTKKLIQQENLIHPPDSFVHPKRSPNSPWIELRFNTDAEMNEVVRLVKLGVTAI
ncbi:luciferase domain-containing protein [Oleiphilus messinensis]|nr:luciferase family protein [Oleiphilus messinensis]